MFKSTKESTYPVYNPYIHGTNSSILALLPKTEFTVLSPVEMISRYQLAPITGEITEGGLRNLQSDSKSAFGRLQLTGANHYTLSKIIRNYAIPHTTSLLSKEKLIDNVKQEFQHLFRCSFSNINILLIYLARAKQAGITNRELISEAQEATIVAQMEATIQFHYLILLFGNQINPDRTKFDHLTEEQTKDTLYAISTHLSLHALVGKMTQSPINLKAIYESQELDSSALASVLTLLELPKQSTISICNDSFNISYTDKSVTLEETSIFSFQSGADTDCFLSEEEYLKQIRAREHPLYAIDVINRLVDSDYHQVKENFLRYFSAKKLPEDFFIELKSLVLKQIEVFQHRFDLLNNLLAKEPVHVLNAYDEQLITEGFPLVLICERDENMTLINETTMEYRAEEPLKLGENITMIATDSSEHREIIVEYLRRYELTSVSVILFEQLRQSNVSGTRPIGIEIAASEREKPKSTIADFSASYQPLMFHANPQGGLMVRSDILNVNEAGTSTLDK